MPKAAIGEGRLTLALEAGLFIAVFFADAPALPRFPLASGPAAAGASAGAGAVAATATLGAAAAGTSAGAGALAARHRRGRLVRTPAYADAVVCEQARVALV